MQTEGVLDFVIASDVYEHIEAPVERAFNNARKLLKDSGVFIFSVPFSHPGEKDIPLLEHYPELYDYQVVKEMDEYVLLNTTQDGRQQRFEQPVFHGGPGTTLELRLFSEAWVIALLAQAGFNDIVIYSGAEFEHGIHWPGGWSVPMAARIRPTGPGANEVRVQRTVATNGIPVQGNLKAMLNRIWDNCLSCFPP